MSLYILATKTTNKIYRDTICSKCFFNSTKKHKCRILESSNGENISGDWKFMDGKFVCWSFETKGEQLSLF